MKLPKPDLKTFPMTRGEMENFLRSKGLVDEAAYRPAELDKNGREISTNPVRYYVDLLNLVRDHNFYELRKYYEGMLPNVEVTQFAVNNFDDRLGVKFLMGKKEIEREELDRLINLRVFL